MDNKNEIGNFIRQYRKKKNITLRELSKDTDVSFSHLSKIERGEHNPSKTTLDILADQLGVDKDKLYLMAGYVPINYPGNKQDEKTAIMNKIANDFPDADLMFHDLAGMSAEDLQEVYEFIKFKKSQQKDK